MREFKRFFTEEFLFLVFLFALFLTITALVLVLLSGRSRRERLLLEYEAQKVASALIESTRGGAALDPEQLAQLEERIAGFGLYGPDGVAVERFGSAPALLRAPGRLVQPGSPQSVIVQYHEERKTITLIRRVGVIPRMAPGMTEMHRRMPGTTQPLPQRMGPGGAQLLFLELKVEGYWSAHRVYKAASVAAPLLVLAVLGFVGYLYRKNSLYRKQLVSQQQLARLGEVSRTLSHEIKNPLSAIRIQTGILRKTLPASRRGKLRIIEEEVSRLSLLTDRIGEFLRDPAGRPESVELDAFIRGLIERYDRPITYRNLAADGEPLRVRFDPERLRSVLENLLNNALESADTVEAPVEVLLSVGRSGVEIAVRDRGAGIPEDGAEKIFDPFYTSKINGSGVGLSISKRFVEAAGGRLTVENRKGGGTEARVTLPPGGGA